jgi:hypothetical protein
VVEPAEVEVDVDTVEVEVVKVDPVEMGPEMGTVDWGSDAVPPPEGQRKTAATATAATATRQPAATKMVFFLDRRLDDRLVWDREGGKGGRLSFALSDQCVGSWSTVSLPKGTPGSLGMVPAISSRRGHYRRVAPAALLHSSVLPRAAQLVCFWMATPDA